MKTTQFALLVGLALGAALAFGGFAEFLVMAVLAGVGAGIGSVLEGRIDPAALTERLKR